MIKAKGFDETYVRIYDDCVDVIVDRQEITQQEAAQIQDIITRITSLEAKDIRISLLKISGNRIFRQKAEKPCNCRGFWV